MRRTGYVLCIVSSITLLLIPIYLSDAEFAHLCADLRNVCTEAGMFAIRDERDYVVQEDFMKAVRKMNDAKKLETTISYDSSFGEGKG